MQSTHHLPETGIAFRAAHFLSLVVGFDMIEVREGDLAKRSNLLSCCFLVHIQITDTVILLPLFQPPTPQDPQQSTPPFHFRRFAPRSRLPAPAPPTIHFRFRLRGHVTKIGRQSRVASGRWWRWRRVATTGRSENFDRGGRLMGICRASRRVYMYKASLIRTKIIQRIAGSRRH